ncbi:MAG: lipoate protein ligase C-terminal domain-containing protein [Candidatus Thorarchaeota archaeon]
MKKAILKAEKGVIELELGIQDDFISFLKVTGDFFIYPEEALEILEIKMLTTKLDDNSIREKMSQIYAEENLITPGITIENWVELFMLAINS